MPHEELVRAVMEAAHPDLVEGTAQYQSTFNSYNKMKDEVLKGILANAGVIVPEITGKPWWENPWENIPGWPKPGPTIPAPTVTPQEDPQKEEARRVAYYRNLLSEASAAPQLGKADATSRLATIKHLKDLMLGEAKTLPERNLLTGAEQFAAAWNETLGDADKARTFMEGYVNQYVTAEEGRAPTPGEIETAKHNRWLEGFQQDNEDWNRYWEIQKEAGIGGRATAQLAQQAGQFATTEERLREKMRLDEETTRRKEAFDKQNEKQRIIEAIMQLQTGTATRMTELAGQLAPSAIVPGQEYIYGFEPGGVAESIAKLGKVGFTPRRAVGTTIDLSAPAQNIPGIEEALARYANLGGG